jgi:hypothetical protein
VGEEVGSWRGKKLKSSKIKEGRRIKDNAETQRSRRNADKAKARRKRREFVAFERKSPPFAKGAKDRAPSRSFVR